MTVKELHDQLAHVLKHWPENADVPIEFETPEIWKSYHLCDGYSFRAGSRQEWFVIRIPEGPNPGRKIKP